MHLHAGQFVTALWVFIPRLTFPNSCLATVFYSVGMVMVSQNGHIGSRLKAMVIIPGAWWVGSLMGGITVSDHTSPTPLTTSLYALPLCISMLQPKPSCLLCTAPLSFPEWTHTAGCMLLTKCMLLSTRQSMCCIACVLQCCTTAAACFQFLCVCTYCNKHTFTMILYLQSSIVQTSCSTAYLGF